MWIQQARVNGIWKFAPLVFVTALVFSTVSLVLACCVLCIEGPFHVWPDRWRGFYFQNVGQEWFQTFIMPVLVWYSYVSLILASIFLHLRTLTPGCWSFPHPFMWITRIRFDLAQILWASLAAGVAIGIALHGPAPLWWNSILVALSVLAFSCLYWVALDLPAVIRNRKK